MQGVGGRWSQAAFSVSRPQGHQNQFLRSDDARVVMMCEFAWGEGSSRAAEAAPEVPPSVVECLDGPMATLVLEILVNGIVEGFVLQMKGASMLKRALAQCPAVVQAALVPVLQSKLLLSVVCWLHSVVDEQALEANPKLAVNMAELCEVAVSRAERGWLFLGEGRLLDYCIQCVRLLHKRHFHPHKSASNATWRLVHLMLATLHMESPELEYAIRQITIHREDALSSASVDHTKACYVFHHLARIVIARPIPGSTSEVQAFAAELAGLMMGSSMAHTKAPILSLLVQKARFFSREKSLDLFAGGFDRLCAVESVFTKGKKAGSRLPEFRAWVDIADADQSVTVRLAETFGKVAKEVDEKRHKAAADDMAKVTMRIEATAQATSKNAAKEQSILSKRSIREWQLEAECGRYEARGLVLAKREARKYREAQVGWLRVKSKLEAETGVLARRGDGDGKRWTLDVWVDKRHMRRKLVRMNNAFTVGPIAAEGETLKTMDAGGGEAKRLAKMLPPRKVTSVEELDSEEEVVAGGRGGTLSRRSEAADGDDDVSVDDLSLLSGEDGAEGEDERVQAPAVKRGGGLFGGFLGRSKPKEEVGSTEATPLAGAAEGAAEGEGEEEEEEEEVSTVAFGGSELDSDWRLAAFLDEGETAIRAVKATRVSGLERLEGTFVLTQAKGSDRDRDRPTSVYLIPDRAAEALGDEEETDEALERSYAASSGAAQVPFGHPHQTSPGVLRWRASEVRMVCAKLFQLQPLALEIFSKVGGSALVVFQDADTRASIIALLLGNAAGGRVLDQIAPQQGGAWHVDVGTAALRAARRKQVERSWQLGGMSNLDYLLELNVLAGRSVNDLAQYPVMPWVLADYSSDVLDLTKASTFRDLSKPMGALDPTSEEIARARFEDWDEDESGAPPFNHGSHYSTSAHVLHYLVRLEPYTSYHCALQSGRLDLPDRQFHCIAESWESSSGGANTSDVKELIPEFFYNPEFLRNVNNIDLGTRQDGQEVGAVVLPPWAKGDAAEFVRLNRAALESEYVSAHLHEWIDLVFGYKQRGKAAEEACNVFYYLTYEGAVDVTRLEEGVTREAVVAQITNFGQTPRQLLSKPHPPRTTNPWPNVMTHPECLHQAAAVNVGSSVGDVLFYGDRFIAYTSNACPVPPTGEVCLVPHLGRPGAAAVLQTDTRRKNAVLERLHEGPVSAMATSPAGCTLATGGDDGVVRVWDVSEPQWWSYPIRPLVPGAPSLTGHSDRVTCLAVSQVHGVCVSGCAGGVVVAWDIKRGSALHVLLCNNGVEEAVVGVSIDEESGTMVACSTGGVWVWTANGVLVGEMLRGRVRGFDVPCTSICMRHGSVYSHKELVITGHADGKVRFWRVAVQGDKAMECVWTMRATQGAVTAVATSVGCRELAAGDCNGSAVVWRPSMEQGGVARIAKEIMAQRQMIHAFVRGLGWADGFEISVDQARSIAVSAGDCTEPFDSNTWALPVSAEDGGGGQVEEGLRETAMGVYWVLYQRYLREIVEDLAQRTMGGEHKILSDVDAFVEGWRGQDWGQFWLGLADFISDAFPEVESGWLEAALDVST